MDLINVLAEDNDVGLTRTSAIIAEVLTAAGWAVRVHTLDSAPEPDGAPPAVANVFLERIVPAWLESARANLFVPNQEWFDEADLPYLGKLDLVLCKTRYAQEIFDRLACPTAFTSFTSFDRRLPDVPPQEGFFHLAGRSLQKGTVALVDLWHAHPEWPRLTIVQHPETRLPVTAPNLSYVSAYLDDAALRRLQNAHRRHLCPSEAEGFGHSLVEAMSCGALVLTTDGPPMNELVAPGRGVLAAPARTGQQGLGENFYVERAALEEAVGRVLAMDPGRQAALGAAAREWYVGNDRFFRQAFPAAVAGAVGG